MAPQFIRQNLQFQHMLLALPGTATGSGWPSGLRQCVQVAVYVLASHGIIDAILQRAKNAVTHGLSSTPSTNITKLLPPCMKPLLRQHPMQYPGTKLMVSLSCYLCCGASGLKPQAIVVDNTRPSLGKQFIGDNTSSSGSVFLWGKHMVNRYILSFTDNEALVAVITSTHAKVSYLCFSCGN